MIFYSSYKPGVALYWDWGNGVTRQHIRGSLGWVLSFSVKHHSIKAVMMLAAFVFHLVGSLYLMCWVTVNNLYPPYLLIYHHIHLFTCTEKRMDSLINQSALTRSLKSKAGSIIKVFKMNLNLQSLHPDYKGLWMRNWMDFFSNLTT